MIRENQRLLNHLNVLSDAVLTFLALPIAYWIRFFLMPSGVAGIPFQNYLWLAAAFTLVQIFTYALFGLYQSFRKTRLLDELFRLWQASLLDMVLLLSWLFVEWEVHYSRWTFVLFFLISVGALSGKRIVLRKLLRYFRQKGYNQKHVLIVGGGETALQYLKEIQRDRELGYHPVGYIADHTTKQMAGLRCLGSYDHLEKVLERQKPDEVISAIGVEDYHRMPQIISACEKTGSKLSIIPFYADYMPSNPQFDSLNGIPLMNLRRIPLDNWGHAFCKRAMDIVGSALLLLLTSPVMLFCAAGVRLSSPGPVFFRQKRIGRSKRPFYMYKFRSMRVNDEQDTGWSGQTDSRKTRFGAFLRKCSLDEFPQFWNVLKGDMSLVGPRPEVPYYVEQFKEEVPLYMVKHQVRPGITGWAQVNGLRGDTSIKARIEHDVYYIEHWSLGFDLKILWMTLFKGKFLNDESLSGSAPGR